MPGGIMEGLITLSEVVEGMRTSSLAENYLPSRDGAATLGQEDGSFHVLPEDEDMERGPGNVERRGCDASSKISDSDNKTGIVKEQRKQKSFGVLEYGCAHYKRRCRIRAPCCGDVYDCRHCHNEIKNANEKIPGKRHDLPRHAVESVICSICSFEQEVQQICKNCGVCMGEYYCGKCKFFDDDVEKGQYHCDGCGICRVGGRDNFFHCQRCGCCYGTKWETDHRCVEKSMHQNCPVCFEYLFDSLIDISVLTCGHTIHTECWDEMLKRAQYACPICSKSAITMTDNWRQLDEEVAATPMPAAYQNKMVWILCNDCGVTSKVTFHIIAQKCSNCHSYNTRRTAGRPDLERPGTSFNVTM